MCACVFVFGSGNTNRPEMIYRYFSALISLFLKIIPNSQAKKYRKRKIHTLGFYYFFLPTLLLKLFSPLPLTHTEEKTNCHCVKEHGEHHFAVNKLRPLGEKDLRRLKGRNIRKFFF